MSQQQHHEPSTEQPRSGFAGPRLQLPRFQLAASAPQPDVAAPAAPDAQHAPRQMPQPPVFGGAARTSEPAPRSAAPSAFVTHAAAMPTPQHQAPPQPQYAPAPQQYVAAPQHQAPAPQYAPASPHQAPAPQYAPAHQYVPAPQYASTPQYAPSPQYAAVQQHAPAPVQAAYAAPAPMSAPPRMPAVTVAATPTARTTSSISWDRLDSPARGERTLLQRITPVHMGVLMLLVVIATVVTSGPAAMKTPSGESLGPVTVAGGGSYYDPIRAGSTAIDAATVNGAGVAAPAKATVAANAAAAATVGAATTAHAVGGVTPGDGLLKVGSATVPQDIRHGGIPSPAAAANLAISGGGRVEANSTGALRMDGIPSAAAAEALGPQSLPYKPSDGVTLPRGNGERDSHAVDTHYGAASLPKEAPVDLPVMTPGDSAVHSERRAIQQGLSSPDGIPSPGLADRAF